MDTNYDVGTDDISLCPQNEKHYLTFLANGECWSSTHWRVNEFEEHLSLTFLGSGGIVDGCRDEITITVPTDFINQGSFELRGSDQNPNKIPTIEWSVFDFNDNIHATYTIDCEKNSRLNAVSINMTDFPVHLEVSLDAHLSSILPLESSDQINQMTISDGKMRLSITSNKDPADELSSCAKPDSSSTWILNGACQTKNAFHHISADYFEIRLSSWSDYYDETMFIRVSKDYLLGEEEKLSRDYDDPFWSGFFIGGSDYLVSSYDLCDTDRSYFIIDQISADSSVLAGRFGARFCQYSEFSTWGVYDYIDIAEASFQSYRLD